MAKNYKPIAASIAAQSSGTQYKKDINTSNWNLFLLNGTALNPSNTALSNGAVLVWLSSHYSVGLSADHVTFTDNYGRYGVTLPSGKKVTIKFYGQ
jgi:hypothetical protein